MPSSLGGHGFMVFIVLSFIHWEDENTLNYYVAYRLLYTNDLTFMTV